MDNTGLSAVAAAADAVSQKDHEQAIVTTATTNREMGEKAGAAAAKARISTILSAKEAAGRDELARHLAFNTDMAAVDAVATLAAAPKASAPASGAPQALLDAAMAATPTPKVSAEDVTSHDSMNAGLAASVTRQLAKINKAPIQRQ